MRLLLPLSILLAIFDWPSRPAHGEEPLAVAIPERSAPVDFRTEVWPLLQRNCIACHNARQPEGGLVLESHNKILEGGDSGPGVIPEDIDSSPVWLRASGREEPLMPPEGNAVGATPLAAEQLGLLKLWIEQGAAPGSAAEEPSIRFQPLPEAVQPIYALDISPDGQWVAGGRGNQVVINRVADGEEVTRLIDPRVEEQVGTPAASIDIVQSIAFSPDGQRIATGGYRTVSLWRREDQRIRSAPLAHAGGLVACSTAGKQLALVNAVGQVELWNLETNERLSTLADHDAPITGLAYGGDRLFTSDASGRLTAWDRNTGQKSVALETARSLGRLVATTDGNWIASIDAGKRIAVWRFTAAADGAASDSSPRLEAVELAGPAGITDAACVAVLDAPRLLAVGTESGAGVLFKLETGEELRRVNHGAPVDAIAADPPGVLLGTGGRDGMTRLWQVATGEPAGVAEGDSNHRLATARDERDLARQQRAVERMTARTAELEAVVKNESDAAAKILAARDAAAEKLAGAEKMLADAAAQLAATEAAIATAKGEADVAQKAADSAEAELAKLETAPAEEPDSTGAASTEQRTENPTPASEASTEDATVKLREQIEASRKAAAEATARAEQATGQLEPHKKAVADAEQMKQSAAAELDQHEQTLAAARQAVERATAAVPAHAAQVERERLRVADLQRRVTSAHTRAAAARSGVVAIAFSPDSASVATADAGGVVRLHRTNDGYPLTRFGGTGEAVAGLLFLANQHLVACGAVGPAAEWSLQPRWQLERRIGSAEESPISDRVTALDFSPDGLLLAAGSGPPSRHGEVVVFATRTGDLLRDFDAVHSDSVFSLRFSPDGRTLASAAADKTIRLLDVAAGEDLRSLEGHTHHVLGVAWQDDGVTLGSASADGSVKIWSVESGEQQRTITGFAKEVTAIDFLGQSSQIVTACADGQARLHNAADGAHLRSFAAAGDFLYAVAATPDGARLLAGGQEGVLRAWTIADGALVWESR